MKPSPKTQLKKKPAGADECAKKPASATADEEVNQSAIMTASASPKREKKGRGKARRWVADREAGAIAEWVCEAYDNIERLYKNSGIPNELS